MSLKKWEKESAIVTIKAIIYIIVVLLVTSLGIKTAKNKSKAIPNLKYSITHRTCAGKLRGTYPNCADIRNEEGFVCFNIIDSTSDVIGFMIMGGIVKVEIKKGGEN